MHRFHDLGQRENVPHPGDDSVAPLLLVLAASPRGEREQSAPARVIAADVRGGGVLDCDDPATDHLTHALRNDACEAPVECEVDRGD